MKLFAAWFCCAALLPAQDSPLRVVKPQGLFVIRPYKAPVVPPGRLMDSPRAGNMIRAGHLYLSIQDALTLAIENNLDLEIDRYGPLLARSALERAQAGGPIRGVPSASAQVSSVDSGVGVNGSTVSAGLSNNSGTGGTGGGGAASIQQIGAITPNLDPTLQNTTTFTHLSQPQANTLLSQTTALLIGEHTYNTVLQQGLLTGGYVQFRDYEQYVKENAPSDSLNPALGPHMDVLLRHSLLQGFGIALNDRGIRIARKNIAAAGLTFRSQLLDLVASVLNRYWDVASGYEEVKARQNALEIAQKFCDDTAKEISFGAQARFELPRAQAELAVRRQDLFIAQASLRQQSAILKQLLSRARNPALEAAEIIPLDTIQVPETEDLPPLRQLVQTAAGTRPDVAIARIRDENAKTNAAGTENPLLPSLQITAQTYNRGAAGTAQFGSGGGPNSYFVGGYGTALGQIFRRDFPNNQVSLTFSAPLENRQAQGDYGIDQVLLRQSEVSGQRDSNQIAVDISNQASALRQARLRFSAAANTRKLQEQLLAAEQERFSYGASSVSDLIVDQRNLAAAQISEVNARASYAHARVSLDQVLGRTLEVNHIVMAQALH